MGKIRKFLSNGKKQAIKMIAMVLPKKYYCTACGKKSAFFLDFGVKSPAFEKLNVIGGGAEEKRCLPKMQVE